ncbi:MAG: ribonuclease P protein component [Alphaproteobacteria bacterium]|nr:ribonuclease P protein component [Alphaproteobacteria bacterium]
MAARFWRVAVRKAARSCRPDLPAVGRKLEILRKRAAFLAIAASGKRWVAPGFILQIGTAHPATPAVFYGLTASRKIGNAVTRNRARRRLRALAAEILPHASPEHDYVLIARATTPTGKYNDLRQDLVKGLKRMKVWREDACP